MMKNKNIIIAAVAGFLVGAVAVGAIAQYQYRKKNEARGYVTAMAKFIKGTPACYGALQNLSAKGQGMNAPAPQPAVRPVAAKPATAPAPKRPAR
ncbi:MAG: hypothetical protein FWC61_03220 [Proteobacteria bacterium]|nr:hypothetical protein [Pseudomonadota bacterium]